ncbi:MAG: pantoate--beta-alanine ligase [Elusimicrobia bacterium]|nr:pantoate--beta-alanine ligase [Elusimicrobiota bacterium]
MQRLTKRWRAEHRTVGFVPTMGALHQGHVSLIERARRENDRVIVSIFVNPTQFGPKEDYLRYPRPFATDCRLVQAAGGDALFAPSVAAMSPGGDPLVWVTVRNLSETLCGPFRPGHFRGVATVVAKLFSLVQPHRAYFGEKDYQQFIIIQRMVRELHLPIRVVPCLTVRAADGLALSSRNSYLAPRERMEAGKLYQALRWGAYRFCHPDRAAGARRILRQILAEMRAILATIPHVRIDYVSAVHPETLQPLSLARCPALLAVAVWIGRTRLIDNIVVG